MADRLIEKRWGMAGPREMDAKLDVLRRRADYLAEKINRTGAHSYDAQEYAALMWALAELSGIGEEVRSEKAEQLQVKASAAREAVNRAEHAEALNVQYRVTVAALKAEIYRLTRPESVTATTAKEDSRLPDDVECSECGWKTRVVWSLKNSSNGYGVCPECRASLLKVRQ